MAVLCVLTLVAIGTMGRTAVVVRSIGTACRLTALRTFPRVAGRYAGQISVAANPRLIIRGVSKGKTHNGESLMISSENETC